MTFTKRRKNRTLLLRNTTKEKIENSMRRRKVVVTRFFNNSEFSFCFVTGDTNKVREILGEKFYDSETRIKGEQEAGERKNNNHRNIVKRATKRGE